VCLHNDRDCKLEDKGMRFQRSKSSGQMVSFQTCRSLCHSTIETMVFGVPDFTLMWIVNTWKRRKTTNGVRVIDLCENSKEPRLQTKLKTLRLSPSSTIIKVRKSGFPNNLSRLVFFGRFRSFLFPFAHIQRLKT